MHGKIITILATLAVIALATRVSIPLVSSVANTVANKS
jgi:hypothetical protein